MPINNVDINSISPDIRDMLLNRNLILSDTITKNSLTSLAVGLGKPVEIDNGNNYVVQHPDIVNDGLLYNQLITNQNNLFRARLENVLNQFDYVFKMKVLEFYKGQGLKL